MRLSVAIFRGLAAVATAALLVLLSDGGRATAQQPAAQPVARPADRVAIDAAIERGVGYLRGAQKQAGHWGEGTGAGGGKGWAVGYTALAGIALIECGVPASDPGLKKAAAGVRAYVGELDSTYEVALAILFLDRMGDKKDRRSVQVLAARLAAGQAATGGWGYKVPKLSAVEHDTVIGALRKLAPPQPAEAPSVRDRPSSLGLCIKASDDTLVRPPPAFDPEKARTNALSGLTPAMKRWPVFVPANQLALTDPADRRAELVTPTTDNSNTHFAMLAMWAARKHDFPAERSLALLAQRFRTSQNADGSWGYDYARGGKGSGTPAMTCAALLGIAIAHVVDPEPNARPEQDPRVVNSFAWLSRRVGSPTGRTDNLPAPKDVGGLYYLWAVERVAVLYDVGKLGKKDWYLWGAEILLCHQKGDGSWDEGGYHGQHAALNTAFALLFLKRANLTPDLSRRLTVDTTELVAKVDDTVKPEPMTPVVTPQPKSEPPRQPDPPMPTPEPKQPTIPPVTPPTPTTPVVTQPQEPVATSSEPATTSKKSSAWLWILLVVLVLLLLGGAGYYFFVAKKRASAEAAAKPKKKKKKLKVQAEE